MFSRGSMQLRGAGLRDQRHTEQTQFIHSQGKSAAAHLQPVPPLLQRKTSPDTKPRSGPGCGTLPMSRAWGDSWRSESGP